MFFCPYSETKSCWMGKKINKQTKQNQNVFSCTEERYADKSMVNKWPFLVNWKKSIIRVQFLLLFIIDIYFMPCNMKSIQFVIHVINTIEWVCFWSIHSKLWFYPQSSAACRDEWLQAISSAIDDYTKKETRFISVRNPEMVNHLIEITCNWL